MKKLFGLLMIAVFCSMISSSVFAVNQPTNLPVKHIAPGIGGEGAMTDDQPPGDPTTTDQPPGVPTTTLPTRLAPDLAPAWGGMSMPPGFFACRFYVYGGKIMEKVDRDDGHWDWSTQDPIEWIPDNEYDNASGSKLEGVIVRVSNPHQTQTTTSNNNPVDFFGVNNGSKVIFEKAGYDKVEFYLLDLLIPVYQEVTPRNRYKVWMKRNP